MPRATDLRYRLPGMAAALLMACAVLLAGARHLPAAEGGPAPRLGTRSLPFFSGPLTASGAVGVPFAFTVAVSGALTLAALDVPPGLAFDPASGLFSGTPQASALYRPRVVASNLGGSSTATLTIAVDAPPEMAGLPSQVLTTLGRSASTTFVVSDGLTATGALVVRVAGGDPAILPPDLIRLVGDGDDGVRTLWCTPLALGQTTLRLTVSDGTATRTEVLPVAVVASPTPALPCTPPAADAAARAGIQVTPQADGTFGVLAAPGRRFTCILDLRELLAGGGTTPSISCLGASPLATVAVARTYTRTAADDTAELTVTCTGQGSTTVTILADTGLNRFTNRFTLRLVDPILAPLPTDPGTVVGGNTTGGGGGCGTGGALALVLAGWWLAGRRRR